MGLVPIPAIPPSPLPMRRIVRTWWPLAASWLFMAAELPAISAVVARLANPEIHLAAYGGLVFPLALIIESPIIMLLAASTALSKDWASYLTLRGFMMRTSALMTALHVMIAFTPLYYFVARRIIGVPAEIVEPARLGLMILTPWTWSIAYRRFHQGVLIRFGHSQAVGLGTLIRLSAVGSVLTIGYLLGRIPGIVVGSGAVITGVMCEAIYVWLRVRPVLRYQLKLAPAVEPALTFPAFRAFYVPLVMTSLLTLLMEPIGSAALSRMPRALESLAVWPVISGLLFMLQSAGVAFNEVVIALLDEPGSTRGLRRFTILLMAVVTVLILALAATPLSALWFGRVSGLAAPLASLARRALWLALPMPGLSALMSWYQGALVNVRRTRGITEAVVAFMVTNSLILVAGVALGAAVGLYVALGAFTAGVVAQTGWLWWRSRPAIQAVQKRDLTGESLQPAGASAD